MLNSKNCCFKILPGIGGLNPTDFDIFSGSYINTKKSGCLDRGTKKVFNGIHWYFRDFKHIYLFYL